MNNTFATTQFFNFNLSFCSMHTAIFSKYEHYAIKIVQQLVISSKLAWSHLNAAGKNICCCCCCWGKGGIMPGIGIADGGAVIVGLTIPLPTKPITFNCHFY